ncbi:MAG TPA: cation diffusion facilitator family transporter [Atribacter sp.]|uniref:Ferrous-iron efflux pump FieF n=1 Tax=Candidatus Atribacter allofermentans TaxID=1852833 RepID=A0A1V5T0L2_9BACT|nr:cation diffusion facilitator family transporter [Atribacter sp.]MDD3713625.1 cation diffusion facilitator family transporter [Atribacterota bacterium]OQA59961.1 MAG: Ferrous-iron efflux pump FieF [Candidatus Atribacteria bacterium ADurb.Bin276]HHT10544.1 cation transporter [Candidatus Atribacteria bacterium]MDI9595644.1 cation diffusion facilitator family transporter [Atribacterota bacterium]HQK83456.1 cation diffusion facilitator family transporter [Atribacter sp.]
MTEQARYYAIRNVLLGILILNWGVALTKLLYGRFIGSASMVADGFHSLSDGASNIIGLIAISISVRPADVNHPYGHKKFESFASIAIALLLFIVSIDILRGAVGRLGKPVVPEVTISSFIVMAIVLLVNIIVVRFETRIGRRLHSDILTSDALHTMSDIFVSISVVITLVAVRLGAVWLDVVAAMVIAGLILKSGVEILLRSSDVLCDRIIVDPSVITDVVLSIPEVKGCHKIRTRGRKDDIHIDLHLLVADNMDVQNAHEIANQVEIALKKNIPGVSDVVVHVEPVTDI